jgi:hypothetical protein
MTAMLATLVLAMVHVAPLQEPAPAKQDSAAILDQLIERSRAVKSFSATYLVTRSDQEGSAKIRLDYRAPEDLRMDMETDKGTLSTWSLGDILDVRGAFDGKQSGFHLDNGPIRAELQPIEDQLQRNFPIAKSPDRQRRSVVPTTWSINRTTNKLDYEMSIGTLDAATTFGWLETIKKKQADLVEDGEQLRCSTDDGRADVVLSKTSGFLEKLFFRKPESTSTMTIALESLVLDEAIDPARFEVPPLAAGVGDASADQRKAAEQSARMDLHDRVWSRATHACAMAEVDSDLRARFESTLKPLCELTCHAGFDAWLASTRKNVDKFAAFLRQKDEAGVSKEDLDQTRDDYRSMLITTLDGIETPLGTNLKVPKATADAACGPKLLDIEHKLVKSVFRELVRKPILDEFEEATKTD